MVERRRSKLREQPPASDNHPRLKELAEKIKQGLADRLGGYRTAMERSIEIGNWLIEAKALCRVELGHGHWGKWLTQNFKKEFKRSARSANLYMDLANLIKLTTDPQVKERVLDMGLNEAVHFLKENLNSDIRNRRLSKEKLNTALNNHLYGAFELLEHMKERLGPDAWQAYLDKLNEQDVSSINWLLTTPQLPAEEGIFEPEWEEADDEDADEEAA
jgi:hypothetical protein